MQGFKVFSFLNFKFTQKTSTLRLHTFNNNIYLEIFIYNTFTIQHKRKFSLH